MWILHKNGKFSKLMHYKQNIEVIPSLYGATLVNVETILKSQVDEFKHHNFLVPMFLVLSAINLFLLEAAEINLYD